MIVQLPNMPLSSEALFILLLLLPGFLALRISEVLNPGSKDDDAFSRTVTGLLFSLIVYTVYWFSAWFLNIVGLPPAPQFPLQMEKVGLAQEPTPTFYFLILFFVLVPLGIALGLLWGWLQGTGRVYKLLRKWKITRLTEKPSVWVQAFDKFGDRNHIKVRLKSGKIYVGTPKWHSTNENLEVFLITQDREQAPIWMTDPAKGGKVKLHGSGLLITHNAEIETIEFDKVEEVQ